MGREISAERGVKVESGEDGELGEFFQAKNNGQHRAAHIFL